MPRKYTHTAAFAHFGTVPRNVQWSWSARNEASRIVVVTLWQDEFRKADSGKLVYVRGPIWEEASKKRLGHLELMENLRWAIDHCVGQVNVIVAIAKDTKAKPRSISECFPGKMRLRVTNLDEATGAFGFETIE